MNRVLILVNITGLIIGISYGLHGPILPVFAKNIIGATYSELGLIGLTNFIPYMFIPLFVGILLDRINNGYLLALGAVINSASIYLLSIAQSVPEIMGFRIMTGVAHAFFWPPCESIISNESNEKNRVKNISWFTMFFVIGFMVGPLLGTGILEGLDITYRILFQIAAFILAVAIITALLASRKGVRNHHERFSFSSIKEMKRFPEVIILLIFCTSSFGIILTIYPAFLNDNGMTATDILLLYFVFGISRVADSDCCDNCSINGISHISCCRFDHYFCSCIGSNGIWF
jgi:MFS family permease